MPYVGEGRAALLAESREYYWVPYVFVESFIKGGNVHDAFQFVVDFAKNKPTFGKWKEMVEPEHTYRDLTDLKEAAVECWKENTTLFYVCVESVIKYTNIEENKQRLDSLKMVIDTMCYLMDNKNEKIQKDIRINLRKSIGTRFIRYLLKKRDMMYAIKRWSMEDAKEQQLKLTLEDCFNEEKLFYLLKNVSLSLNNLFGGQNQPINNVPDFPSVNCSLEHEDAYPLFRDKKKEGITFVGEESDGLIVKQDEKFLVVKDQMDCEVTTKIGYRLCRVHYKLRIVEHELLVFQVWFSKSAAFSDNRIYIQIGRFEFVSPECFFVMQEFPDLYAMAKALYRDPEGDLD